MLKGWAQFISMQRNLSAYRFVSRIFERDVSVSDVTPCKNLSLLDDAGDPDIVHAFVFGNFSYLKSSNCTSHYPTTVFIRKEEANSFLYRARDYKSFLEQLSKPMGLAIAPKPGTAYLVDARDCKIVGSISASNMTIQIANPI